MRAKQVSIAVSAIILGGWLTAAAAQDAGASDSSSLGSMPAWQVQSYGNLPPGVVGQPQPWKPGTVVGIALGELYTDNLTLSQSGHPKESDWITVVTPFVRAARSGPRFSGVVNYSLTGYAYADHSHNNSVAQDLDARGRLTVVPQHFFLDGFAKYEHQNMDDFVPPGYGTFFIGTGRTDVGVAQLSPVWEQNLGAAGRMTLRYSLGRVVYDYGNSNSNFVSPLSDVTSNGVQFKLEQPRDAKLGWNLNYVYQRLNPSYGPDVEFQTATAGVWYRVNQTLRFVGDLGRENNYRADGSARGLGATRWDVGLEWATPVNSVILKLGHRFFGPSSEFQWTHTATRLSTVLRYEQRPADINSEILNQNLGPGTVWPVNVTPQYPNLTARGPGLYILRRGTFGLSYEMPSSKLSASVYSEARDYFVPDGGPEHVSQATVAWAFQLGSRTTLTPSVQWQRLKYEGGLDSNPRSEQIALMHQVTAHDIATLRYRHGAWDYEQFMAPTNNYDVNVFYAQWIHLF